MAAFIEVAYDRQYTDADVQSIAARMGTTLSVLLQLGSEFHNLPGFHLAPLQVQHAGLLADMGALAELIDQIRVLLIAIDAKAGPLDEKSKALLRVLQGLLMTDADRALLYQITGATSQSGGGAPPPSPPPPPAP